MDKIMKRPCKAAKLACAFLLAAAWLMAAPSVNSATYGQQVVAAVLLAEARSEGRTGMLAVAEVIRVRADHYGLSPLAVVKMTKQFSCLNNTTPPELIRRHWTNAHWQAALDIARMTYNQAEQLPNLSRQATHFHSDQAPWARGRRPVAVIGKLKFYRLNLPPL